MADRTGTATQVQHLFDAKASAWPSKYARGGRLVAGRLTKLADAVAYHVSPKGMVLDLGCGTGELTITIAASGMRTTGCDISSEMIRIASAADMSCDVDWVELEPGWQVLPFRQETFDGVVASSVFEYVHDPVSVLRECRRVLRPGGIVLCTVPDPRHPVRWVEWLVGISGRRPLIRAFSRRSHRLDSFLTYLDVPQQRHLTPWWHAAAANAGLSNMHCVRGWVRSPLHLFALQRLIEGADE